jgi:hypothetical protein
MPAEFGGFAMRTSIIAIFSIFLIILFTGCVENHEPGTNDDIETTSEGVSVIAAALVDNTPDGIGVLAFVNDPHTTVDVLDKDVPLDRRAARNIIHYRDGWDRIAGTSDDNLFNDIAELDSVRWVGPSALARIQNYAAVIGWIPQGSEFLGTWDKVTFSVIEAGIVLDYVNHANYELLDVELSLDRRAANSIIEAQPIATIADLADGYYVGQKALATIKSAALAEQAQKIVVE